MSVRIDVKFPPQDTEWRDLRTCALFADKCEHLTGMWLFDHLQSVTTGPNGSDAPLPIFEGWTVLSALSSITERLRLGLMVSSVPYRAPGLLAKMVTTLDVISDGRIELGLGAGNNSEEAHAFGLEMRGTAERIAALGEACEVLRLLFDTKGPVSYEGKYYGLHEAVNLPRPIQGRIPFTIGGKGEKRTFPIVAEYADFWNFSNGTPDEFGTKFRLLKSVFDRLELNKTMPVSSVQIQIRATPDDETLKLVEQFVANGAQQIILYSIADPNKFGYVADFAERIAGLFSSS